VTAATAKKEPELVRIKFCERESGWAEKLPKGRYRLKNIPVFDAAGLCIDDIVTVKPFDNWLMVDKVVKKVFAGKTVVYYDEEYQFHQIVGALKYLGCKCEGMCGAKDGRPGFLVTVYPKGVNPVKVAEKLGVTQKGR
jgi:hypothetical protein